MWSPVCDKLNPASSNGCLSAGKDVPEVRARSGLRRGEICRQIIPDEDRMAEALLQALPVEVSDYLFEEQSDSAGD